MKDNFKNTERLTAAQKNANKKQWYKDKANELEASHNTMYALRNGNISEYRKMKVCYNIFNNILNAKDFEYVCKPFGAEKGELPANMVNRDISSAKIKVLLGMEMKRPFSWKVIATNSEATSRKEQEEFRRIKEFVVNEITRPIKQDIALRKQAKAKGRELTEEEQVQVQKEIEAELKSMTPTEVRKYMAREHQDPAEVMSHQLLEYLIQKTDIRRKFNTAFKHLSLSAKELMYIGVLNGEPEAWNVNSLRVKVHRSALSPFVEDAEAITVRHRMTPSEIVRYFGDELSNKQLDEIFTAYIGNNSEDDLFVVADQESEEFDGEYKNYNNIDVTHCVWKSLRKLCFLYFLDENDKEQVILVDESYKLDEEVGDIRIEHEWVPETYETWKLGKHYLNMQPVAGQFRDIDNLYDSKLPYYGVYVDDMNSDPTSPMDRLLIYQYYYNIVMYRLELLLASDKGKKVMMNINAIPDSAGIDIDKWQYFFESSPFMWFNPNEEGTGYNDVNTMAKTIDLSLASDIGKYVEFAEYLKRQAGASIGITEAVEGQAGPGDSVGNNRQNLVQTSNILEPFFDLHNSFKKNVLTALIEAAKVAYSGKEIVKLSYVLDDMSLKMFDLDMNLLNNSKLGLFVSNSTKAEESLQTIKQLAHAAMQNQKAELSDVLSVIRQEGIVEAEETLKAAEQKRKEEEQQIEERKGEQAQQLEQMKQKGAQQLHENEKEIVILKEEEKRKTVIAQSALTGMSFNPDADGDGDGENDFLEIARDGVDANIKRAQINLDRDKLNHDKSIDNKKIELEEKKLKNDSKKLNNKK